MKTSPSLILAIDDDPSVLQFYREELRETGHQVETAVTAAGGLEKVRQLSPDVILLDIEMPDRSGLETYQEIRATNSRIPTIFITGGDMTEYAIQAMALGAYEYLQKPVHIEPLRALIARAIEVGRLMRVPAVVPEISAPYKTDVLLGRSATMQAVYKQIGRVAPQNVTVLIRGESGSGKELVARAIYHYPWPGNLREFQSVLKYALLQAAGPVLLPEFLPPQLQRAYSTGIRTSVAAGAPWNEVLEARLCAGAQNLYEDWQALTDRHIFERVLQHTQGNISHAARILGIHRTTLRGRLDKLGIDISSSDASSDITSPAPDGS